MTGQELIALAKQVAQTHQLFPQVVAAICEQESGWNPYEVRFEPAWYNRTDWDSLLKGWTYPRMESQESERVCRSMSWGLMQVLGQTARERGFQDWLPVLADPATGLEWGCRTLAFKMSRTEGNISQALELYNGGANPNYAAEVLARAPKYLP